jgi:hypothetical protein
LLICANPLLETITRSQLGILMLTLFVAALCCHREGKPFFAGLLVALATMLKVYSALLVLYFVYRKEWQALIGCAVGFLGFALVIPSAVFGSELAVGLSVYWFSEVVLPFVKPYGESLPFPELQSHTIAKNQSLYGTFSHIVEMLQGRALGPGCVWIKAAVAVGCVALLVLLFLGWRGKKESFGPHRLLFEWSISMMFGLLIIPTAWSHYFSLLVFPLASAMLHFHDGASAGDRRLLRRSLIAVAVLSGVYALASLLYPLVEDTSLGLGRAIIMVPRSIGLYCWATLILGGTFVYLLAGSTSAKPGRLSSQVSQVQGR